MTDNTQGKDPVEGEGSFKGAKQYNVETSEAAKHPEQIAKDAEKAAAALDGEESAELKDAVEKGNKPTRD